MNDKELAVELTKTYIQAYVSGIFTTNTTAQYKINAIDLSKFTDAYKQFYDILTNSDKK